MSRQDEQLDAGLFDYGDQSSLRAVDRGAIDGCGQFGVPAATPNDKRRKFSSCLHGAMHSQWGHEKMHRAQASFTRGGQMGLGGLLGWPLKLSDIMYRGDNLARNERVASLQ